VLQENKAKAQDEWVRQIKRTGFITSSWQRADAANTQQLPQKLQLNDLTYDPAMLETAELSSKFSFQFPALTRALKSVQQLLLAH